MDIEFYEEEKRPRTGGKVEWNLHMPLKIGGRKAPKGGAPNLDFLRYGSKTSDGKIIFGENFYDFLAGHKTTNYDGKWTEFDLSRINKQAWKDMSKIDLEFENAEIIEIGTTKSGVDFVSGWICQDYGEAVVIFLYWDGKHIRAFVPYRGNCIDTINKCMINEDYDNLEYFKKYFKDFYDKYYDAAEDYLDLEYLDEFLGIEWEDYNYPLCLEEFESRIEVI